jgi:hypothetical protein
MTRTPVDGVMCVVWARGNSVPFFAYWNNDRWMVNAWRWLYPEEVTHWTTLDEAKAAPELVEAGRTVVDDYNKACEERYDEMKWDVFGGVQPLAFALAKIGATHATP